MGSHVGAAPERRIDKEWLRHSIRHETTGADRFFWVKLNRCNSSEGAGEEAEIAKEELPEDTLQAGWNTVRFQWAEDGT